MFFEYRKIYLTLYQKIPRYNEAFVKRGKDPQPFENVFIRIMNKLQCRRAADFKPPMYSDEQIRLYTSFIQREQLQKSIIDAFAPISH
jgi:hypothetical protein